MTSYDVQKIEIMQKMGDCVPPDKAVEFIILLNQFECLVIGKCNQQIGK